MSFNLQKYQKSFDKDLTETLTETLSYLGSDVSLDDLISHLREEKILTPYPDLFTEILRPNLFTDFLKPKSKKMDKIINDKIYDLISTIYGFYFVSHLMLDGKEFPIQGSSWDGSVDSNDKFECDEEEFHSINYMENIINKTGTMVIMPPTSYDPNDIEYSIFSKRNEMHFFNGNLEIINTSGFNNDHRGSDHFLIDAPFEEVVYLESPSFDDFVNALFLIKSHKTDFHYEMFCDVSLQFNEEKVVMTLSFDHGS